MSLKCSRATAPIEATTARVFWQSASVIIEADVSSDGIVGQQTNFNPTKKVGNEVLPAHTDVNQLNGSPRGTQDWEFIGSTIVTAYLNGHIEDSQPGMKYAGEEQIGGYDFDLAGVDADAKKGNDDHGCVWWWTASQRLQRQRFSFDRKGNGQMVKFQLDSIMLFRDRENDTTHYEGILTEEMTRTVRFLF